MSTAKDRTAASKNPSSTAKKTAPKKAKRQSTWKPFTLADRLTADHNLFTIAEAQQLACCSRTKIRDDRRAGKLPSIQRGRNVRFTAATMRAYLATEQHPATPDARVTHLPPRKEASR